MEAHQAPTVHLELESRPESVAMVRAMLAGAAEMLEFGPELLVDLKTAASEACNNVIMHAYGDGVGPLIVDFAASPAAVEVTVRDCGGGIGDMVWQENSTALGIPVINALAARAEFLTSPAQGTEVRMLFAYRDRDLPQVRATVPAPPALPAAALVEGQVVLSVAPVSLLSGILGRLAGAVAVAAYLSVDHYSDVYLIADRIASHAAEFACGDTISVGLSAGARRIDLRVGPFPPGTSSRLPADQLGLPPPHTLIVEYGSAEAGEDAETMQFTLIDLQVGTAASG